MTDPVKTCTNCGNTQADGEFCEVCGTRMPEAAQPVPAQPAAAQPAAAQPAGATWAASAGAGAAGQGYAPQGYPQGPGYYAPQQMPGGDQGSWGKLFDLSFQGFIGKSTLKTVYAVIMGLIGLWVIFEIVLVAMLGGKYAVISFFISIFMAGFCFFISRVVFELMATVMNLRDKLDK